MIPLSLWNADHLVGLNSTDQIAVNWPVSGLNDVKSTFVTSNSTNTVVDVGGQNELNVSCNSSSGSNMYFWLPTINEMVSWGFSRVYSGFRFRCNAVNTSARFLYFNNGVYGLTAAANTVFVIEVITDCETKTRKAYVNGTQVTNVPTGLNDRIAIGSGGSIRILSSSNHSMNLMDMYTIVTDPATDPNPPDRIGTMIVRSAPVVSVTNDERFEVIGGGSVVDALNAPRTSGADLSHGVITDPNGSAMSVKFERPAVVPEGVIGATVMLSTALSPEDAGDPVTVTATAGDAVMEMMPVAAVPMQDYQSTPLGGVEVWDADAIANVSLSIRSNKLE
ncbi:hypothetical protein pEaSNUABM37_00210 [Erwinia phage pEa_SNUABM_37]|nr:hypothetical protein pEaSNUABM37_00210 [Erwinia phage pEa_SNUABM_37]QXO10680.1 hypothetical protein pEaSNUABM48_00210 [Erwinia phage pEa_SNUABM_48]